MYRRQQWQITPLAITLEILEFAVIQVDFQAPHTELAIPISQVDQAVIVQQPIRLVIICIWGMTIEGIVEIFTMIFVIIINLRGKL